MTTWRQHAACRNVDDVAIFFPARANTPQAALAAAHCLACPVAVQCHQDAMDFGRTDGLVQAGAYWAAGKPIPIRITDAPDPKPSRSERATARRREAINRYYEIRNQHPNDTPAYRRIAEEYGVSTATVREWHRQTRAENTRRLTELNQTAREAA